MKKHSAFSLIELSVVILIIGILIAGVTQGSRLIAAFRLQTAINLTNNSPVSGINNLVSWYETTLETSFDASETVDGGNLSSWYDNNTQKTSKLNATQATTANKPFYYIDPASKLPFTKYVSNDYFNLPDGTVPYKNSSYTIFLVTKIAANCSCGILGSGTYGSDNLTNAFRYEAGAGGIIFNYWWNNDIATSSGSMSPADTLRIITVTYNNLSGRSSYVNGTIQSTSAANFAINRNSTAINNTIGVTANTEYLTNGLIGEIIIFERALKNEERQSIESYLAKKFNIKLS